MNANLQRALLVALAVAVVAGFTMLGRWQLSRGEAKETWLREHAEAMASAPQPLARVLDELDGSVRDDVALDEVALPRRVEGRGRYVPEDTVLLDNQIRNGRVGLMVYTRFQPNGTTRSVLVNRGFVPMPADRTVPAIAAPPPDEIAIAGLLARPPSAGLRLGAADEGDARPALLASLDLAALAKDMHEGLSPAVLQLSDDAPYGFERAFEALPNTLPPERHRGYAVQWFGLAAAVAAITLFMLFRRR